MGKIEDYSIKQTYFKKHNVGEMALLTEVEEIIKLRGEPFSDFNKQALRSFVKVLRKEEK